MANKPVALIILDGFGFSEESQSNAIKEANTPFWDNLWANYPKSLVATSGLAVGLPEGQMGNSEVGHMNIGAGRIVYQNYTRINKAIEEGTILENAALTKAIDTAVSADKAVHVFGLASPGGVHSHDMHIAGLVEMAAKRGAKKVYVHAFLDGRDTPPRSAESTLKMLDEKLAELGVGHVASMIGRYYAMDRDNRWDRVQLAFDLITQGKAEHTAASALEGLEKAYAADKDDEFCPATIIEKDGKVATVEDGDVILFANFRPDRAREITKAFVDADIADMDLSKRPAIADFVMMTEYAADIDASCAFPPEDLVNTLGEVVANAGGKQLRIAETEKYAHVTFFFNGGRESEFAGERRELVPSPKVATYDLQPEMNAPIVTEKLIAQVETGELDLIVCNYANPDMVGHTGNMEAAVKAVEAVDEALSKIIPAILKAGGEALITADHGNVELMVDPETGGAVTSHTTFPVPLVYACQDANKATNLKDGRLCDLAPTILKLLSIEQPKEMTGEALV
ncbi:2,3-bisphosphoglycerate-independent phosphoglycerate mutase [Salinibius halmophilus]|uniref:2,3-bisphosphoglycerate-independent phosphoglycerate mutase n=1 Tax=Salinibius halmophilus TaxID=1853216 RepID=UPI000E662F5F|nr:2,3-bisphosphoglycerate-independent phosphoglycerate mutase [Salinibius halmophilus]